MNNRAFSRRQNYSEIYKQHFGLLSQVLSLADRSLDQLSNRELGVSDVSRLQCVLIAAFYQAKDTLGAIGLLLDDGYSEEAKPLVRKLIESAINLRYLAQNVEERLDRFTYYTDVMNYMRITKIVKNEKFPANLRENLSKRIPQLLQDLEEAKESLGAESESKLLDLFRRGWSGRSVLKMAEDTDLTENYVTFERCSISTHASNQGLANYYDENKTAFYSFVSEEEIPEFVLEASKGFLITNELLIKEFELKLLEPFNEVARKLSDLYDATDQSLKR